MTWILQSARWLGHRRASIVVGVTYVFALLAGLTLSPPASTISFAICPLFVAIYCAARPTGGWNVFALSAAPAAGSAIVGDTLGAPRWLIGWGIAVIALIVLNHEDQPSEGSSSLAP